MLNLKHVVIVVFHSVNFYYYITVQNVVSVTKHHGMTVSVNHAQVSIATTSATSTAVVSIAMARPSSPGNSSGSEADGVVSTTALRRMHFKSARNAKSRGPSVPKVLYYTEYKKNYTI